MLKCNFGIVPNGTLIMNGFSAQYQQTRTFKMIMKKKTLAILNAELPHNSSINHFKNSPKKKRTLFSIRLRILLIKSFIHEINFLEGIKILKTIKKIHKKLRSGKSFLITIFRGRFSASFSCLNRCDMCKDY
jgi:hypothetical protein